jgi:L-histidine N-alpha-methyltransferase
MTESPAALSEAPKALSEVSQFLSEAQPALPEAPSVLREAVLSEALAGLTASPKTLAPWLFYDEAGSHLFDAITDLPEYYLTRTERALFTQLGRSLPAHLASPVTIAELGAGSAGKTGILLREFALHQNGVLYQPIDISPTALDEAAASIAASIPGVIVAPTVANYITERYSITRPAGHKILALYIGSSIGNFAPAEQAAILRNLRAHLAPGDALLLGLDLAPSATKSIDTLLAAYDDAAGITAAFNKNILIRLNRELDATFNPDLFAHRSRWNAAESRIEMHLEALTPHTVHIDRRRLSFAQGETIHTENSYKFTEPAIHALLADSGFAVGHITRDDHHRYAVVLAHAI